MIFFNIGRFGWETYRFASSYTAQSLFHTVSEAFGLRSLQQVNYSSVAKACQTDSHTVELIIREIVATMAQLVSKGSSININFKVGLFSVRNGYMNFK